MIENSDCCIVAADHSKFSRTAFTKISKLSVADYIVTNKSISPEVVDELKGLGIKVLNVIHNGQNLGENLLNKQNGLKSLTVIS